MTHPEKQPQEQPKGIHYQQALFDHMHDEHGLILLNSEMNEIMRICHKIEQECEQFHANPPASLPVETPEEYLIKHLAQLFKITSLDVPYGRDRALELIRDCIAARRDAVAQEKDLLHKDYSQLLAMMQADLTAARQETLAAREELTGVKRVAQDRYGIILQNEEYANREKRELEAQLTQANQKANRAETEARLSDRLANDIRHMAQMADRVDPDGSDDRDALYEIECTAEFADKAHKAARNAQQPSRTPAKPHELNVSAEGETT